MDKNSLKNLFKPENKKLKTNILSVFIIGVLCIVVGNTFFGPKSADTQNEIPSTEKNSVETFSEGYDNTEKSLEKRLESILSQIEGAGALKVMVTTSCSTEVVLAQETKKELTTTQEQAGQGDVRKIESEKTENKFVITEDKNGRGAPLVLKEEVPKIEGIVIVAQGGGDAIVKDSLTKAAQALLDVPAHKVQVLKMK